MLVREENPRSRVESEALHVAVPDGEDLGACAVHADEGVVGRDAAVVAEPDDAPRVVARILGAVPVPAVPERDEEVPVRGETEPRAEMASAARLREGAEQHLNVFQPAAAKPPARDFRAGAAPGTARVAQVHPSVLLEVRVEGDIEEASLAARVHPGHAGDRLGIEAARRHRAEPARAFGHQHPAVRQEREPPWMVEPGRDLHHRERVLFGFERVGRGGRRRNDETRDDRSPEHGSPGFGSQRAASHPERVARRCLEGETAPRALPRRSGSPVPVPVLAPAPQRRRPGKRLMRRTSGGTGGSRRLSRPGWRRRGSSPPMRRGSSPGSSTP